MQKYYTHQMKTHVDILLEEEGKLTTGAAYLVPADWWQEACFFNFDASSANDVVFPQLDLTNYVDDFLLEFKEGILEELQHKCNYLKFGKTTISPEIKRNFAWKVVSPTLWKRISNSLRPKLSLLTFYDHESPSKAIEGPAAQVQIIFCSKDRSHAYIGYLPQDSCIVEAVRSIGFELGFIQMQNSRIVFPECNAEKLYYFLEFQKKTVSEVPDTLLIVFNLENKEDEKKEADFSFGLDVDSNHAVAGEQGGMNTSWDHLLRNDGTMSTGAETPSFVFSENQEAEFRVRELFREKKPEEIFQMKVYAEKCINGLLIGLPNLSEEELELELEAVALEIVQTAHAHKKKALKDKQKE